MKKILTIIAISSLFFASCSKDEVVQTVESNGKTSISFDATVNGADLALNKDFTIGANTYNFSKFRYWVSNLVLVNSKGEEYKVPSSYYLIEETGAVAVQDGAFTYPATKREDVVLADIPAGDYTSIKFSVGVDEKYNSNMSLQAGELSQLNGMTNISWMWMTSYIFTSVTGTVKDATSTKTLKVETGLNANYKTVSLTLPSTLKIGSSKTGAIVLNVDVAKVFDGVDVIANPTVGASQATVMAAVAANYQGKVFTVKSVK